jgi:subtilisin family serine protease
LVSFGYDLVGDAFDGTNVPFPDPDPFDCGGHGTHVAGIVAAQTNNPYGIIGAATGVTLGAYRVFGCDGSSPDGKQSSFVLLLTSQG